MAGLCEGGNEVPGSLKAIFMAFTTLKFTGTTPHVLEDAPLINRQHIHFLHDGAPAHFSRTARRYLDRRFPDRWIGRGGPIAWPPRSPDRNPLDFYLSIVTDRSGENICFEWITKDCQKLYINNASGKKGYRKSKKEMGSVNRPMSLNDVDDDDQNEEDKKQLLGHSVALLQYETKPIGTASVGGCKVQLWAEEVKQHLSSDIPGLLL
ncbi:hypothetical protein ANN_09235 [Periplaneta americana]|uniref:Uncharacterized protein n=1 Tax=Periplaneta americana TaxID=6978 RepID=A0ABQ8TM89_PERAM|nr:hypothetical protein ANN_09235 [Periplaneta americana]